MAAFLASIVLSASLFLIFKAFERYRINLLGAIVVNYWTCVLSGLVWLPGPHLYTLLESTWLSYALILGCCFIMTFYLMGYATQQAGAGPASVASKLSLMIPVIFSAVVLGTSRSWNILNFLGMVLILVAIVLMSIRRQYHPSGFHWQNLLLLFAVFGLNGFIDAMLNYVNATQLGAGQQGTFSIVVFFIAGLLGLLVIFVRQFRLNKSTIGKKELIGGILLGLPNVFSLYFMLRALSFFKHDGALMFPVFNILIILLSTLGAFLLFSEKPNTANRWGIGLAIVGLALATHQELLSLLA